MLRSCIWSQNFGRKRDIFAICELNAMQRKGLASYCEPAFRALCPQLILRHLKLVFYIPWAARLIIARIYSMHEAVFVWRSIVPGIPSASLSTVGTNRFGWSGFNRLRYNYRVATYFYGIWCLVFHSFTLDLCVVQLLRFLVHNWVNCGVYRGSIASYLKQYNKNESRPSLPPSLTSSPPFRFV